MGAAEQTLTILHRHHASRWQTLGAMRLSIAASQRDAGLDHLKTLCADPKVDERLLAEAVDLFCSRKWSSYSDALLCGFVASELASPAVPIVLIRRFVRNKHAAKPRCIVLLRPQVETGRIPPGNPRVHQGDCQSQGLARNRSAHTWQSIVGGSAPTISCGASAATPCTRFATTALPSDGCATGNPARASRRGCW